jgi:mono/diheme cytochrome c family protein
LTVARRAIFAAVIAAGGAMAGCQSNTGGAPPVTAALVAASTQHSDARTLGRGRELFTSRCIACHALPVIADHLPAKWPGIIDEMAHRSELSAADRDAVVAYVLAVRAAP